MHKILKFLVILMMTMGVMNVSAQAKIVEVVSKKGVRAWLMESHVLPMVSVEVNFRAGSVFEPKGKEGLAQMMAGLLDEGAGPYEAKEYKDELEAIGARLGGSFDTQDVGVNLTTLTEHKARAFELLGMAIQQPRFDDEAVSRIRDTMLANIRRGDEDPATVAWRVFRPAVYGAHAYANNGEGTLESIEKIAKKDIQKWHADGLTRANMTVQVVGDVTPAELAELLDVALGDVPAGKVKNVVKEGPQEPKKAVLTKQMKVPQGTVLLGHLGLPRDDKDYYAMLVMNEILGGGVLTSRLGRDVREKHGLVYDVRSVNSPLPFNGLFYVSLATDNTKVEKALGLVRKHLKGIKEKPVSVKEFDDAKSYLIGSFPLRLDSNSKLLNMLALMQGEALGEDYLQRWPERIAAVTREDVQRVAKRLIHEDKMVLVVVGDGPALKVGF